MGKITHNKRINAQRSNADPIGNKLIPLADEIESLKLAKNKLNMPENGSSLKAKKMQAEEEVRKFFAVIIKDMSY